MHIPYGFIFTLDDPWRRLGWAILFRAVADLYITSRRSSAEYYLRSRRAEILMDQLGIDAPALLACHNLT